MVSALFTCHYPPTLRINLLLIFFVITVVVDINIDCELHVALLTVALWLYHKRNGMKKLSCRALLKRAERNKMM